MSNFIWVLKFYGFSDRDRPQNYEEKKGNLPKHLRTDRFPSVKTSITVYYAASTHSIKIIIQFGTLNKMLWFIWKLGSKILFHKK